MVANLNETSISASNTSLIPVLVTGIQQRRVCGAEDSFHAKDFAWLDSCDKHRNEGCGEGAVTPFAYLEGASP